MDMREPTLSDEGSFSVLWASASEDPIFKNYTKIILEQIITVGGNNNGEQYSSRLNIEYSTTYVH